MRQVRVHPENSIRFTESARVYTQIINEFKRQNPGVSFRKIAEHFSMTEVNVRRYYYGIHHLNESPKTCYSQIREGACVAI